MARWLNNVEVMCPDTSREKELIDWYDKVHLGDVLDTPGFVSGKFYEAKELRDGRGKYLAMYDIETDDIDRTMALRVERCKQEAEQKRSSTAFRYVWRDVLWRLIGERKANKEHNPKMEKWVNLVEIICTVPSREKEFNDWYDNIGLVDVLETPGFMAARRYEMKEYRSGRGKYFTVYDIETDDIDRTMALRAEKRKEETALGRQVDIFAPIWEHFQCKLLLEYR